MTVSRPRVSVCVLLARLECRGRSFFNTAKWIDNAPEQWQGFGMDRAKTSGAQIDISRH